MNQEAGEDIGCRLSFPSPECVGLAGVVPAVHGLLDGYGPLIAT